MHLNLKVPTLAKIALRLAAAAVAGLYAVSQVDFSADPAKNIQHFTGRMAL